MGKRFKTGDRVVSIYGKAELGVFEGYKGSSVLPCLVRLDDGGRLHTLEGRLIKLSAADHKRTLELSQRLNQTVSDNGHARTLQDHPNKTNDGGSDGDSK